MTLVQLIHFAVVVHVNDASIVIIAIAVSVDVVFS